VNTLHVTTSITKAQLKVNSLHIKMSVVLCNFTSKLFTDMQNGQEATGWMVEESWFDFRQRARDFSLAHSAPTGTGGYLASFLSDGHLGLFSGHKVAAS
jgi:hypothetical protein